MSPALSISAPANLPFGRLKTLPALGRESGCFSLRWRVGLHHALLCAAVVMLQLKRSERTTTSGAAYLPVRLPKSAFWFQTSSTRPFLRMRTLLMICRISAPYAPAFIATAPPTVPGMPLNTQPHQVHVDTFARENGECGARGHVTVVSTKSGVVSGVSMRMITPG